MNTWIDQPTLLEIWWFNADMMRDLIVIRWDSTVILQPAIYGGFNQLFDGDWISNHQIYVGILASTVYRDFTYQRRIDMVWYVCVHVCPKRKYTPSSILIGQRSLPISRNP